MLRQVHTFCGTLLGSAVRSLTTASGQFKIFIIQEPRQAHLPSGSIILSRAKNNGFSRFSKRGESDKIFQNPSTSKGIKIQRQAFKNTPAKTSKNVQRSQQGNSIFEYNREFRVSSELTELVVGKPLHQGSITYIDQDHNTRSAGRARPAHLRRRDHVPGVQGARWHVDTRWWQRQPCRKRRHRCIRRMMVCRLTMVGHL